MKKFLLASVAMAVVMAVALPVRAQDEKKVEKPKQFTGEITKIEGTSVTVKNKQAEEKTFSAGEKLKVVVLGKEAGELTDLKVGDKVTVHYKDDAGKNVASKIVHADAKAKKKEAKAEK